MKDRNKKEKPMEIEVGKRYKLRNGLLTTKIRFSNNRTRYIFEAKVREPWHKKLSVMCWLESGRYIVNGHDNRFDIIEELDESKK